MVKATRVLEPSQTGGVLGQPGTHHICMGHRTHSPLDRVLSACKVQVTREVVTMALLQQEEEQQLWQQILVVTHGPSAPTLGICGEGDPTATAMAHRFRGSKPCVLQGKRSLSRQVEEVLAVETRMVANGFATMHESSMHSGSVLGLLGYDVSPLCAAPRGLPILN